MTHRAVVVRGGVQAFCVCAQASRSTTRRKAHTPFSPWSSRGSRRGAASGVWERSNGTNLRPVWFR